MIAKEKPLPEDYEHLFSGEGYDVVIRKKVKAELISDASEDQRTSLDDLIERYAESGPSGLPKTKFNGNEGWYPSDKAPGKIRLMAFKPWQLRAYGFCRGFNGRPTFFITGIDPSKKQNKADPGILKSSGAEAVRVNELVK